MTADPDRPLSGRRVLLTRPADRGEGLERRLRAWGAEVEQRSTIALEPPLDGGPADAAVAELARYDWILFTSVNGVGFFHERLAGRGTPERIPRVACIGGATADALRGRGIDPALVATESRAEGLADLVARHLKGGERVLWVRPERARPVLQERLALAGAELDAVVFYRNVPAPGLDEIVADLCAGRYDAIVFTAPSTLERLLDEAGTSRKALLAALAEIEVVAIGEVTARTVESTGLAVAALAREPSDEGLAQAVLSVFSD